MAYLSWVMLVCRPKKTNLFAKKGNVCEFAAARRAPAALRVSPRARALARISLTTISLRKRNESAASDDKSRHAQISPLIVD